LVEIGLCRNHTASSQKDTHGRGIPPVSKALMERDFTRPSRSQSLKSGANEFLHYPLCWNWSLCADLGGALCFDHLRPKAATTNIEPGNKLALS
jgi:hypothetical protein